MITRKEFRKAVVEATERYNSDDDDAIVIGNREYGHAGYAGLSLGRTWVRHRGALIRNMTSRAYSDPAMYPLRREWVANLRAERAKGKVRIP